MGKGRGLFPVSRQHIRPGFHLPGSLKTRHGQVVLPAGVVLTDAHIAKLVPLLKAGLFADERWDAPSGERQDGEPGLDDVVSVDHLRVGATVTRGLYDDAGVLLLAAGSVITPRFLTLLRQRGVRQLRLASECDAADRTAPIPAARRSACPPADTEAGGRGAARADAARPRQRARSRVRRRIPHAGRARVVRDPIHADGVHRSAITRQRSARHDRQHAELRP